MEPVDKLTIDSCHSRWFFDTEHRRFRRALKGFDSAGQAMLTEWRPYHELILDPESDAFTVVLNDAGTRMLRSWRHTAVSCSLCGETETEELSLADIASVDG